MAQRSDTPIKRAVAAERRRVEQLEALWAMSPEERVAAMWRCELSLLQLQAWSAKRPHEVPRIATDLTSAGEPGEFAWIVMTTPEWAEADEAAAREAA